jgi:hypothetical protein
MASSKHAITCPNCHGTWFREERLLQIDSSIVVRDDLPVPAQAVDVHYRYICVQCNQVLTQRWEGRHE